ncbi:MAG TPA: Ppx/GppA phosphatase family protein [Acidimicrobiales bacterium]|jgi:exopolyphosphatase/guanosine-5'-triphosphate,3'-diphosphate pyrophosphatase|nr:Ppx/GppA phosphatase family protein [Acidimicrobiales bacterium]
MTEPAAVAAVDCGTNSTRLLVVRASGEVAAREMRITRLGAGVDASRRLQPEAIERTLAVLKEYRAIMDDEQVTRARLVATSAVRDAQNSVAFLEPASEVVGVRAEILSGDEEGRVSYEGATDDLPVIGGQTVLIDIGGGSTEVVTVAGGAIAAVSLDIGCVRLTERYLKDDPPTPEQVDAASEAIDVELERATRRSPALATMGPGDRLVGVAGTVSTLASLELGLTRYDRDRIHHSILKRTSVRRWCELLGAERVQDRAKRPAITKGREDVIFGGALVLWRAMARFGFAECVVSEADILDGLVLGLRATGPTVER